MARIGFIGLGTMGGPMARQLVRAGHQVAGFDLGAAAVQDHAAAGGEAAATAAAAVAEADFAITMVPDAPQVRQVLFADGGLAQAMDPGCLFIEMSTIHPRETDAIRTALAELGIAMVDAPVGRTSTEAESGELLIMAGGEAGDLARAQPLFAAMGSTIINCGGPGLGARMKIVNNFMSVALNGLTAEALVLAEAVGLSPALALGVLQGTTAGLGHLNTTYPSKVLQGDLSPGFKVDWAFKDLGLALDLARSVQAAVRHGEAAQPLYEQARRQGRGGQDWTAVYQVARRQAGLEDGGDEG